MVLLRRRRTDEGNEFNLWDIKLQAFNKISKKCRQIESRSPENRWTNISSDDSSMGLQIIINLTWQWLLSPFNGRVSVVLTKMSWSDCDALGGLLWFHRNDIKFWLNREFNNFLPDSIFIFHFIWCPLIWSSFKDIKCMSILMQDIMLSNESLVVPRPALPERHLSAREGHASIGEKCRAREEARLGSLRIQFIESTRCLHDRHTPWKDQRGGRLLLWCWLLN